VLAAGCSTPDVAAFKPEYNNLNILIFSDKNMTLTTLNKKRRSN